MGIYSILKILHYIFEVEIYLATLGGGSPSQLQSPHSVSPLGSGVTSAVQVSQLPSLWSPSCLGVGIGWCWCPSCDLRPGLA